VFELRAAFRLSIFSSFETRLFKAAEAPSAVRVWGGKRLGVAKNCRKVTPCLNQGVNDAIQANKVVCKELLLDKAESCLHSRYAETLKFSALMVMMSKMG